MRKKQKRSGDRHGLQAVTLCISTALVLILLGLVVFSVLTARNLSAYVKQNIVVTMVLQDDMSSSEAQMFCSRLRKQPYINHLEYISKEQALKDGIKALGTDPREFTDINPFLSSVEITLKADYANNDSLMHITRELKSYPNVGEVKYQRDLVDKVNANIAKISIVLLALAVLLTVVSFSLINNTVKLGIYARPARNRQTDRLFHAQSNQKFFHKICTAAVPLQAVIECPHMQILHKRHFHKIRVLQKPERRLHIIFRDVQKIFRRFQIT